LIQRGSIINNKKVIMKLSYNTMKILKRHFNENKYRINNDELEISLQDLCMIILILQDKQSKLHNNDVKSAIEELKEFQKQYTVRDIF